MKERKKERKKERQKERNTITMYLSTKHTILKIASDSREEELFLGDMDFSRPASDTALCLSGPTQQLPTVHVPQETTA